MLFDPLKNPFDGVEWAGFAIRHVRAGQFHVGFLYKLQGKAARLHHQHSHLDTRDEAPSEFDYLWLNIAPLSQINKRLIANRLSRAGGDKIPYGVGFDLDGEYLDRKTLKYARTDPGEGLTCATYVVSVLENLGFPPFVREGWQSSPEDVEWQRRILEFMASKNPDSAEHFEAEKANVGGPRFRPDHVAGAGAAQKWPIKQDEANSLAEQVVAAHEALRPQGGWRA